MIFIAKVTQAKAEYYPKEPFILSNIAGQSPRMVNFLAKEIATNEGFEPNKTYLVSSTYLGDHPEYGPDYDFKCLKEVDALEIVDSMDKLGKPTSDIAPVNREKEEEVEPAQATQGFASPARVKG